MIRHFRPSDAPAIASIYNHYVEHTTASFEDESLSTEEMCRRIELYDRDVPVLVWEEDGRIEGYCYAHRWKGYAAYAATFEETIYLRPEARGKGAGRALLEALIGHCRQRGVHVLVACITGENTKSCLFHERMGFEKVSEFREVGCKMGRWLDVVDYQLILPVLSA